MKRRHEVLGYALALVGAFLITRHLTRPNTDNERAPALPASAAPASAVPASAAHAGARAPDDAVAHAPRPPDFFRPTAVPNDAASIEERFRLTTLRNAVIGAAAEDMYRRGATVADCLAGVELAGLNKLRFAAQVHATPREAEIARWHFVEVVDGEVLPEGFAACVEKSFGGPHRATATEHEPFPAHDGALDVIYFLPAAR